MAELATLLVIEDEADIRELIAFNLESRNYKVLRAEDGDPRL